MLTFLRSGLRWGRFWRSPDSLLAEGLAQILADLAHFLPHFLPSLAHFTSPIHLSVAELTVPFAMRRTHFVPHFPASLRQFALASARARRASAIAARTSSRPSQRQSASAGTASNSATINTHFIASLLYSRSEERRVG